MSGGRSTDELFASPDKRALVRRLLDDWAETLRELNARLDIGLALVERAERGEAIDWNTLDDHSRAIELLRGLSVEIRDALAPHFADPLPPEWIALLDPATTEAERATAAEEWAARVGLRRLLHKRYATSGQAIREGAGPELRDAIAHALRVAALEAAAPQRSATIKVEGQARRYVRGLEGAALVPRRDLPRTLLAKWMFGEIRRQMMDRFDPAWREREALSAQNAPVVSLETLPPSVAHPEAAESREDLAEQLARLTRLMSDTELRLARLRAAGLTHSEIAASEGVSPAAVRQRLSRLKRRLHLSHPPGKR